MVEYILYVKYYVVFVFLALVLRCVLYIENILNVFHAQLNTLLIRRRTFWYEAMVRGGCSCGHCQFCSKTALFLNFKTHNCAVRLIFLQWSICDYSLKYFLLSNLSNSFEAGGYILVAYWIVFHPDVCRRISNQVTSTIST